MRRFLAWFIRIHTNDWSFPVVCLLFISWLVTGQALGFDPYPFQLLTMAVSLWAILFSLATLAKVDAVHDKVHEDPPETERP